MYSVEKQQQNTKINSGKNSLKVVLFIAYFLLVTVVATILKEIRGTAVPPVSDAILIVGFFFLVGYGLVRLIKLIAKNSFSIKKPKIANISLPKVNIEKALKLLAVSVSIITGLVLVWVIILNLLGYKFDKSYLNYSQKACLDNLDPGPRGIEGCVFWSRANHLEKKEDWYSQFKEKEDYMYCEKLQKENEESCRSKSGWLCGGEPFDPRCDYEAFKLQKINHENWDYLVSGEKDEFYYSCLDNLCPKKSLFRYWK